MIKLTFFKYKNQDLFLDLGHVFITCVLIIPLLRTFLHKCFRAHYLFNI